MSTFFIKTAKNDYKKLQFNLGDGYDDYFFLPFQSSSDLTWSFASIIILPVYYFSFSIILCMEAIFLLINAAYFYPFNTLQSQSYLYNALDEFYFGMIDGFLSLVIGIIASASFLLRLIFGILQIKNSEDSTYHSKKEKIKNDFKLLDDYLELCILQAKTQREDLNIIKNEMRLINQELLLFNQKVIDYESNSTQFKLLVQQKTIGSPIKNHNLRTEMQKELTELLCIYPPAPSSDNMTINAYQDFYNKNAVHHELVLSIFERYRAETYAALNTVKMLHPEYFQDDDKSFKY